MRKKEIQATKKMQKGVVHNIPKAARKANKKVAKKVKKGV